MPPVTCTSNISTTSFNVVSKSLPGTIKAEGNIRNLTKARNAVIARLISCLVNEQIVSGVLYSKIDGIEAYEGKLWCQINRKDDADRNSSSFWFEVQSDRLPMISETSASNRFSISLLDPEDFCFPVYHGDISNASEWSVVTEPRTIMSQIVEWNNLDSSLVDKITMELDSSIFNLNLAYNLNKPLPVLGDSAIAWEQSIVEGHPTHPMNKARYSLPPLQPIDPNYDLMNPDIYLFVVPRNQVTVLGIYDELISQLISEHGQLELDLTTETLVPVHELQIPNIKEKFPFARILKTSDSAIEFKSKAQASLRTIVLDKQQHLNYKLALGIKVTSALRTITPWTTHLGPYFKPIADAVVDDKELLKVADEVASISSNHPDPDTAKHFSCLIREDPEAICKPLGESVIVCAALTERDVESGESIVVKAFGLNSLEERVDFFRQYCDLFLEAFATPVFKYGLTFESHLQNVLARFKPINGKFSLTGFCVRDFGGIKYFPQQLKETTGLSVNVWNDEACQIAHDIEDVHHVAFHTMIQMHLHRIIRCLDLHYSGLGWSMVNEKLQKMLPNECPTRDLWLNSASSDYKAFITMKLDGLYRDYLYTKIPNLINYDFVSKKRIVYEDSCDTDLLNR